MDKKVQKTSEITIEVGLNAERIPIEMNWSASDNPNARHPQACKAMLLALFERETKDTLKIDLWTQDMQIHEMDRMFYQTLRGLADTYYRATQNKELATQMQQFVSYFGEKTGVIPKK